MRLDKIYIVVTDEHGDIAYGVKEDIYDPPIELGKISDAVSKLVKERYPIERIIKEAQLGIDLKKEI